MTAQPPTESLAHVHVDGTQNQTFPQPDFTWTPDLLPAPALINEVSSPFLNLEAAIFSIVLLKSA